MSAKLLKELIFTPHGTAELRAPSGKTLWASDADDDFAAEFQSEFLEDDEDGDDIIDYLIEAGHVKESEELDIITETLDNTAPIGEDDDD